MAAPHSREVAEMAKAPEDMIQAEVARLVAKALTDIAAKLAAPEPEPKQAHLTGKAQPRTYQVTVPGLLAGAMRSTPAAKALRTAFQEASVVNRGRGTTATIVLRGDEEAARMLEVLSEVSNRISHRDIPRAMAELEAALSR